VAYIRNISRYTLRRKCFTDKYMIQIGKKKEREHICQNFHMSIQIICEYLTFLKFKIFIQGIKRNFR